MSGHTPGPWWPARVYGTVYIEARLVSDDRLLQEVAACGPTATPSEQEANARLIAAAPKLLAFADRVFRAFYDAKHDGSVESSMRDEAKALIAAATGETP